MITALVLLNLMITVFAIAWFAKTDMQVKELVKSEKDLWGTMRSLACASDRLSAKLHELECGNGDANE